VYIITFNTGRTSRVLFLFAFLFLAGVSKAQTARNANESKIVKLYPNPASSVIYFEFSDVDKSTSFQVFNFMGKKVYELQNVNNKNTVDLSNFYRGVYIFQLRDKNGKIVESGKFQVVK
jgi:hypothetical protein